MNLLFWVPWVFVHELLDIVVGVPRDVFEAVKARIAPEDR